MLEQVEEVCLDMSETEIEGTDRTLYDYAYGYCHHFALALHERYGVEINVIWGKQEEVWNLVHAYCKKDGKMKDASGEINEAVLEEYRTFFEYDEFKEETLSKEEFMTKLSEMGADRKEIERDVVFVNNYLESQHAFYSF